MQSFNHRGVHLIVYKHAHGLGSRREAHGFLIQMRLEKTEFMTRAIRRAEKFAVVFFCAEDCDFHRLISASHSSASRSNRRLKPTCSLTVFIVLFSGEIWPVTRRKPSLRPTCTSNFKSSEPKPFPCHGSLIRTANSASFVPCSLIKRPTPRIW